MERGVIDSLAHGENDVSQIEQLVEAIDAGSTSEAMALLDLSPSLAKETYGDELAIHCAIRASNQPVIERLVSLGTDVNAAGSNGQTPLHYAIRARQIDLVRLLLDRGSTPTILDESEISPLLLAARSGESAIADELLSRGAILDLHSAVALGRLNDVRRILQEQTAALANTRYKADLLSDAIYVNSAEIVALLLELPGIDVHAYGLSGDMPLVAAVSSSDTNPDIVRLLLAHGADPNRPDKRGSTAIDRATELGTLHLLQQ